MPGLFKQKFTSIDPKTGKKITKNSAKWYGEVRDASGKPHRIPLFTDKSASMAKLTEIIRRMERGDAGLVDRRDEQSNRPLPEHLVDYEKHLKGKNSSTRHLKGSLFRCRTLFDGCQAKSLRELTPANVSNWLSDQRSQKGMSISTANAYLVAVKSFINWMVRDYRTRENPLAHVSRLNAKTDVRIERRALSPEELSALISTTRIEPSYRDLSGLDRSVLYLVAAYTGLRSNELTSLEFQNFDLTSDSPKVTVTAAYSKRRRKDPQLIPSFVVAILRNWISQRTDLRPESKMWPGTWRDRAAAMLRRDLEAARQKWIGEAPEGPERECRAESDFLKSENRTGQVIDFHSLRHTFISILANSGVHPKVAQVLARHSTITLTMDRYSHVESATLSAALESLPSESVGPSNGSKNLTVILTGDSVCAGLPASEPVVSCQKERLEENQRNPFPENTFDVECPDLTERVSSTPGGIRTPDRQIRNLLLYPAELRARNP